MASFDIKVFRPGKLSAASGRKCGDCSLCCKLLLIDEIGKPANQWCQFCRPGKGGCSIYQDRPPVCQRYVCQWLAGGYPEEWYPLHSRMVVSFHEKGDETPVCQIFVDPATPDRWRQRPYHEHIRMLAFKGLSASKDDPSSFTFRTHVHVGSKCWLVLPNKELEIGPNSHTLIFPTSPTEWHAMVFASAEEARRFASKMEVALAKLDEITRGMSQAEREEFAAKIMAESAARTARGRQ